MPKEPVQVRLGSVAARERIQLVDVLRGFALLGVVLQNIVDGGWAHRPDTPTDRSVADILDSFVKLKFQPLFAFMFGVGFCLQLERAEKRGASFSLLYLWREFLLLVIGVAHFILLWSRQDVLINYAIAGGLLLFFKAGESAHAPALCRPEPDRGRARRLSSWRIEETHGTRRNPNGHAGRSCGEQDESGRTRAFSPART